MPSVAKLLEEKQLLEQTQAETVEVEMHERNTEVSSDESLISFRSLKHAVMESVGVLEVTIVRSETTDAWAPWQEAPNRKTPAVVITIFRLTLKSFPGKFTFTHE